MTLEQTSTNYKYFKIWPEFNSKKHSCIAEKKKEDELTLVNRPYNLHGIIDLIFKLI